MTPEYLREIFDYDPETGILSWSDCDENRSSKQRRRLIGKEAGRKSSRYRQVMVNGILFQVHAVIWARETGNWPVDQIDHIDRNGLNNKLCNLREASHSQNQRNRLLADGPTSRVVGVFKPSRGRRWRAVIGTGSR